MARTLLHIVLAATRPLTLQEMNVALTIGETLEGGEPCQSYSELDLEPAEPFRDKLRNLCGLFVRIIDSRIYLCHQTAKEFLISKNIVDVPKNPRNPNFDAWKHSMKPEESNLVLLKICLSFLLLREFDCKLESDPKNSGIWKDAKVYITFMRYAAWHWMVHFQGAGTGDDKAVLQATLVACDTESNRFRRWYWVFSRTLLNDAYPRDPINLIITLSYLGLEPAVKLLLEQGGVNLNSIDGTGRTPLIWAVFKGCLEIIRLLLQQSSININIGDKDGRTALYHAVEKGYLEIVELLLQQPGIDLSIQDRDGQTVLFVSAFMDNLILFKLLLQQPGIKDLKGMTVLISAVSEKSSEKHLETVELLLRQAGVELNIWDFNVEILAKIARNLEIVELLLQLPGIAVGRTALISAVVAGSLEIIKLLLQQPGIGLNRRDDNGWTALMLAARAGNLEITKLLLQQPGIGLNRRDDNGWTALILAARAGNLEIVKLLLQQPGVNLNVNDRDGITLLMMAARVGNLEIVKLLFQHPGFNLNMNDRDSIKVLTMAARAGNLEIVKLLLQQPGIKLDVKDYGGRAALAAAVGAGSLEIVELLLQQPGIEFSIKDGSGRTALSIAKRHKRPDIIKLLEAKAKEKNHYKEPSQTHPDNASKDGNQGGDGGKQAVVQETRGTKRPFPTED